MKAKANWKTRIIKNFVILILFILVILFIILLYVTKQEWLFGTYICWTDVNPYYCNFLQMVIDSDYSNLIKGIGFSLFLFLWIPYLFIEFLRYIRQR